VKNDPPPVDGNSPLITLPALGLRTVALVLAFITELLQFAGLSACAAPALRSADGSTVAIPRQHLTPSWFCKRRATTLPHCAHVTRCMVARAPGSRDTLLPHAPPSAHLPLLPTYKRHLPCVRRTHTHHHLRHAPPPRAFTATCDGMNNCGGNGHACSVVNRRATGTCRKPVRLASYNLLRYLFWVFTL